MTIAAVVIGRNEGDRLVRCLASLDGLSPVIYVDSGSTDGSVAYANEVGAEVVELDMLQPFTAARARNAGLARLDEITSDCVFIQVLDGDCELREGWVSAAQTVMETASEIAIVCGRRRERYPEASLWNWLINIEWDTPVGEAKACGGDALMRREALEDVGGYDPSLIAGEEPEMCYRMRQKGWRIRRIDAEMTWHDADMKKLSQWWQRCRRTGHTYAEGAAKYGLGPERYYVRDFLSALFWGMAVPGLAVLGAAFWSLWALAVILLLPAQMLRLWLRGVPGARAIFLLLGKFPEAQGALGYWLGHLMGRKRQLIEYK